MFGVDEMGKIRRIHFRAGRLIRGRCLIASIVAMLFAATSSAEPDSRGLLSIWSGHQDIPSTDGFLGTGFHIGDGFVVTAKHVAESAGDEWFGIVGSHSAGSNRIGVVSEPHCFDEADICFFRVDPSSALIKNQDLSDPFGITCELPKPWPKVSMKGFSDESEQVKSFENVSIQGTTGTFETPDGTIYENLLQTDAQTSSGTSGSPVVLEGSRDAIGVHVAFSAAAKNQVVFPFYLLKQSIQIEGHVLFDPSRCAAGDFETAAPPQVRVRPVSLGSAGSCIEFGFSKLPEDFDLGSIRMDVSSVDGPNTISPGNNAAIDRRNDFHSIFRYCEFRLFRQ